MAIRKLDAILSERHRPRNALEYLVKRNATREILTDQLRAVVSSAVAPHCQVADMRDGRLTIHVAGAAWATRLRFELPHIETVLRTLSDFAALKEIRIVTMPHR